MPVKLPVILICVSGVASHVMIYLGKDKQGAYLMAGASDGLRFRGRKIYGVSVFDFVPSSSSMRGSFLGYSCIPGFIC